MLKKLFIQTQDTQMNDVKVRIYRPKFSKTNKNSIMIFFHGGLILYTQIVFLIIIFLFIFPFIKVAIRLGQVLN